MICKTCKPTNKRSVLFLILIFLIICCGSYISEVSAKDVTVTLYVDSFKMATPPPLNSDDTDFHLNVFEYVAIRASDGDPSFKNPTFDCVYHEGTFINNKISFVLKNADKYTELDVSILTRGYWKTFDPVDKRKKDATEEHIHTYHLKKDSKSKMLKTGELELYMYFYGTREENKSDNSVVTLNTKTSAIQTIIPSGTKHGDAHGTF